MDACHLLGVAVAVFPASGLAYDEVWGEAQVATWARSRGCPALLWHAVPVNEAALEALATAVQDESTGVWAGLSMVAFSPWAGRAGIIRRWPDGRGIFVQFTTVGDAEIVERGIVVAATDTTKLVGDLFGPATGDSGHRDFHKMAMAEWREGRLESLSPLFLGDTGLFPLFPRAPVDTRAWLDSRHWVEAGRSAKPDMLRSRLGPPAPCNCLAARPWRPGGSGSGGLEPRPSGRGGLVWPPGRIR